MAEAPAGDDILTESDAVNILEELTEAQNHSHILGFMFSIKPVEVEAICKMYQDPKERLCQIILAFLRQAEPPPTWRAIVNALKSKAVNLTALGKKVEAAHFPDPTASRDPPTTSVKDVTPQLPAVSTSNQLPTTSGSAGDGTVAASTEEVERMIAELKCGFNNLKNAIRECLEKQRVLVSKVADVLTSLSPDDDEQHKIFIGSHVEALYQAANISMLFGTMNLHWNYLDPSLLGHLVKEFDLEVMKRQIKGYKSDLQQFRKKTPLNLFCQTQRRKRRRHQEDFKEMVAEFDWPENVTLEEVEQFRQEYASEYSLHECAMMIAHIRSGSYIITWFIPESVVKKLKAKVPREILKKYCVTKLEIAGACVYRSRKAQKEVSVHPRSSSGTGSTASVGATGPPPPGAMPSLNQPKSSSEEDYLFVEQPSKDLFCPVTFGLLLKPHLTSCCGNHISQEAASRIRREGGACPLCNTHPWNTMLNKHFQRQVKSLRVFCRHDDRGCGWQGELVNFDNHVQSCPMRDAPPMTELMKLPLYGGDGATEDQATDHDPSQQIGHLATAAAHLSLKDTGNKLTVKCQETKRAPCLMVRGSVTTDRQFAYFTPNFSTSLYQYEYSREKWIDLPPCPYLDSGLAIIDSELTTVGGGYGRSCTDKLFTLRKEEWVEKYPPMNTARYRPAVVSTSDGDYLIVIGGYGGSQWTATVELFQVKNRRWHKLTDLPQLLPRPSATICGDQLNVIGSDGNGYSCSLQALPSRDRPITSPLTLSWKPLPRLPVSESTAATLCGQLVIIGGRKDGSPVNSIHQLVDGEWVRIGSMASGRCYCLVASPSPDRIIIMGSAYYGSELGAGDSVEECAVV